MENLKFLWRISQNVWKLQKQSAKIHQLSIWQWSSFPGKNYKLSMPVFSQRTPFAPGYQLQPSRSYSTDGDDTKPKKMKLMEFPCIAWPSLIKTIKNFVYTSFIVRPYLDSEFSLGDFVDGSKVAIEVVSNKLAEGKLDDLSGLVSADCLAEVKKNMSHLNAKQRHDIAIKKEDIYFSFAYELGILFDDKKKTSDNSQERFVEITVVHHVLRGHKEMVERGEVVPLNVGVHPQFKDNIFVLNYRFIRNYTKGVSDQWTVNIINHLKPTEFD